MKNHINRTFLLLILITTLAACNSSGKADTLGEKEILKKTDIDFSSLSAQKGMKLAFLEYIDSTGVLLRPGNYPIVGDSARHFLQRDQDSSYTLTWEPLAAELSSSGDMGYTYGIYTVQLKNMPVNNADKGTYVTIWKKQTGGNWKFVLDTGNPGLSK